MLPGPSMEEMKRVVWQGDVVDGSGTPMYSTAFLKRGKLWTVNSVKP